MRNFLFGDESINSYNDSIQNSINNTNFINDILNSDNTEILLFLIIFLLLFTSFGRR